MGPIVKVLMYEIGFYFLDNRANIIDLCFQKVIVVGGKVYNWRHTGGTLMAEPNM